MVLSPDPSRTIRSKENLEVPRSSKDSEVKQMCPEVSPLKYPNNISRDKENNTTKAASPISTDSRQCSNKTENEATTMNGNHDNACATRNGDMEASAFNVASDSENFNDSQDENTENPFTAVKSKKKPKNKKIVKQSGPQSQPSGLQVECARIDKSDKKQRMKKSSIHSSNRPPITPPSPNNKRSFSSSFVNGKSFSSMVANGKNDGNSTITNKTCASKSSISNESLKVCSLTVKNLGTLQSGGKKQTDDVDECIEAFKKDVGIETKKDNFQNETSSHSDVEVISIGEITTASSSAAYCDSVASNDSGTEVKYDERTTYRFEFPRNLVGYFLGRNKSHKRELIKRTGILNVEIHNIAPEAENRSVIELIGTSEKIDRALSIIRKRFPLKRCPDISLDRISSVPRYVELSSSHHAKLVEGTFFPGVIACASSPTQFWVQQYDHPMRYKLDKIEADMAKYYQNPNVPGVENPIIGNVVAVPMKRDTSIGWLRAIVTFVEEESEKVHVKCADYGGIFEYNRKDLRQMHGRFIDVPFFATECALYDVAAPDGIWSKKAQDEFKRLCQDGVVPSVKVAQRIGNSFYYVHIVAFNFENRVCIDVALHLKSHGLAVPWPVTTMQDIQMQHQQWIPYPVNGQVEQQWAIPAVENGQIEQQWAIPAVEDHPIEQQLPAEAVQAEPEH